MDDKKVLKKLNELKVTRYKIKYIDDWIKELKVDISKESIKTIGLGSSSHFFKKWLKRNSKSKITGIDRIVKASKRGHYVFIGESFGIHSKNDLGLPVGVAQQELADQVLDRIIDASTSYEKQVVLPTRAELDSIIKEWKAQPKEIRTAYPMYDFGRKKPRYNAEYLMDLQEVFQSGVAYVNPYQEDASGLYFKWETLDGLLLPIKK